MLQCHERIKSPGLFGMIGGSRHYLNNLFLCSSLIQEFRIKVTPLKVVCKIHNTIPIIIKTGENSTSRSKIHLSIIVLHSAMLRSLK